jgi:hypothetical protein
MFFSSSSSPHHTIHPATIQNPFDASFETYYVNAEPLAGIKEANSEYANDVRTHAIPHPKKLNEIAGPAILAPNPTRTKIPAPTDDPTPYSTKSRAVNVRRKLPVVEDDVVPSPPLSLASASVFRRLIASIVDLSNKFGNIISNDRLMLL